MLTGWHGHLTSSNCVIDSRWVCKITDYGLHYLRQCSIEEERPVEAEWLLWTAPELLPVKKEFRFLGTKEADVYSFGIICQEIFTMSPPYAENKPAVTPDIIIEKVSLQLSPPYQPSVPSGIRSVE